MRSEYRASRDRSPLRHPSPINQRGQFRGPIGHFDDRYGRDSFFDANRRDYRGESGPSRWFGYPTQRFSDYNHEFIDRQWRHADYFYEPDRFRREEELGRDEAFWQNQAWRENRFRSPDLRHDLDCRRENEERHRQEDEQHRRFLVDQEAARYVERLRLEQEDLSRRAAADMVRSGAPSVPIVQDPPSAPSQLPSQDIPQGPTQPDGELNEAFDGKVTPCPLVSSALCDEISGYFTSSITSVQSKSISAEFPLSFEEGGFSLKPPKMNNYLLRRAKSKSMLKEVQIKGEALTKIQLKIMDIAPPRS